MPYTNIHRGARISPSKARLVVDVIRGMPIADAFAQLQTSKKRAAVFVNNGLKAAVANAQEDDADERRLKVVDARVDEGPTIKRFQPKDRGRAHPILKRTSHITISVDAV